MGTKHDEFSYVVRDLSFFCRKQSRAASTPIVAAPTGNARGDDCLVERLSDEVLLKILAYSNSCTITLCKMVNRRWNRLATALLETNWPDFGAADMGYGTILTAEANQMLQKIAPVVRSININHSFHITLNGPFPPFSCLEELSLGETSFCTFETIFQIVSSSHSTLRSLTLEYIRNLTKPFAQRLVPYLKNLHTLTLCYRTDDSNSIEGSIILLSAPEKPRSLCVPIGFSAINEPAVQEIFRSRLKDLEYFDLAGVPIEQESLLSILYDPTVQVDASISPLPLKLKGLRLGACRLFHDASIFGSIGDRLSNLTYLDVSGIKILASDPIRLAQLLWSTPQIKNLMASYNQGFTDDVLLSLLDSCRSLEALSLDGNTELTALGLSRFIRSAPDSLKNLNLEHVKAVTDSVVFEILNLSRKRSWKMFSKDPKNFVSRLNIEFSVRGCSGLTDAILVLYGLRMFEYYLVRPGEVVVGTQPLSSLLWTKEFAGFLSTGFDDTSQFTSVVDSCYPIMFSDFFFCRSDLDPEEHKTMRRRLLMTMGRTLVTSPEILPHSFPLRVRLRQLIREYLQALTTIKDARFAICYFKTVASEVFLDEEETFAECGVNLSVYDDEKLANADLSNDDSNPNLINSFIDLSNISSDTSDSDSDDDDEPFYSDESVGNEESGPDDDFD
ncbi:hypothetical protein BZA70DRAFT_287964 [Myxozyma melibiosi]|uniref:F-box domain-containing protein n=1 Tax=Myxozyma melibiosi TaxID=54550 RepID=A0ABR1F9G2_9ASCO